MSNATNLSAIFAGNFTTYNRKTTEKQRMRGSFLRKLASDWKRPSADHNESANCYVWKYLDFLSSRIPNKTLVSIIFIINGKIRRKYSSRLRAVPLRSVTSKLGRIGESELTERGTWERQEEEGLPSLLNQTCSGNSAHQRRQPVKNKLICHLISNNSASIYRALNPHGFLVDERVFFFMNANTPKKEVFRKGRGRKPNLEVRPLTFAEYVR